MKRKALLAASVLLLTMLFLNGCSQKKTPYEQNDQDGYCVSVKYDANGGFFTDNTTVITDSYNIADMKTNEQGKVDIALLSPSDEQRGKGNFFPPYMDDRFFVGWYTNRTEITDEDGNVITDKDGNVQYSYSGYWDFQEDTLSIDPNGEYTSAEPVLTLYAAWLPVFHVEFFDLNSGEKRDTVTYNPVDDAAIMLPSWNEETGSIVMRTFPERDGYTFNGAYYDMAGTMPIEGESFAHCAVVNYENATAENTTMKIYLDWKEGEWYHIYTAKQFIKKVQLSGNEVSANYVICNDLDFEGMDWDTVFMHQNFNGIIEGDNHTFKNIELIQEDGKKINSGLFGSIDGEAIIRNVNFDNVSFTIQGGTETFGANFGLLAGNIFEGAVLDGVTITNSALKIDSKARLGITDYSIGLLCGMGSTDIDYSGITCVAVGEKPETVMITVDGEVVNVEIVENDDKGDTQ